MRTFIAVEIPAKQKNAIADLQKNLKICDAAVSLVRSDNIHITLKFLGEVSEDKLTGIFKIVDEVGSRYRPFPVGIREKGAFPDFKRPRVVWVGAVTEHNELRNIAEALEISLTREGFPRDSRPFKPHITIGRVKGPRNISTVMEQLREVPFDADSFTAAEIVVMKSDLKPSGAEYTPLKKTKLSGL